MPSNYTRRGNTRKPPITRLLKPAIKIMAIILVLGFMTWLLAKYHPIKFLEANIRWDIDNTSVVEKSVLADNIQAFINNKYLLDLQTIKHILELEPWVENVHIKRLFWNSIQIQVKTHDIAMRWQNIDCNHKNNNHSNCRGYISTKGVLFIPKKLITSNAPLAMTNSNTSVVTKLHQDYQKYQKLSNSMTIKSFSKTNIDQLEFISGVKVVLGYQQQNQRLKKFIQAYRKLKNNNSKINQATFDMRYPKGFAVSY